MLEAAVALARAASGPRVDALEIPQHGVDRRVKAVQVEAVEAAACTGLTVVVPPPQPGDEVMHDGIAPHPLREPPEAGERHVGVGIRRDRAHEPVDTPSVGPVALDRHGAESTRLDQPLRDGGARRVELVRPVRGLAEQHDPRVTDRIDDGIDVVRIGAIGGRERTAEEAESVEGGHALIHCN